MPTTLNKIYSIFLLFIALFSAPYSLAAKESEASGDLKGEIKEYISHHLQDAYDFSLFSYTSDNGEHVYIGFPLPVNLWDNGLNVFMSSKFHHGETIAKSGENYYKLDHGKIYKTDAAGTLTYDADHHATNSKPLDLSITKNVFTVMMVGLLMFFMFSCMAKAYKNNESMPKGMGRLLEPIVIYIRDDIARPNIGEKHYKRYMSYLLTVTRIFYRV